MDVEAQMPRGVTMNILNTSNFGVSMNNDDSLEIFKALDIIEGPERAARLRELAEINQDSIALINTLPIKLGNI